MPSYKADINTENDSHWIDWDGSPLTKQSWYDEIADRQRKHRTLWERGYLIPKSVTITACASPAHSYQLSINNVKEGTIAELNPLLSFEKIDDMKADEALPDAKKARYSDAPDLLADAAGTYSTTSSTRSPTSKRARTTRRPLPPVALTSSCSCG